MVEAITGLGDAGLLLPGSAAVFALLLRRGSVLIALSWLVAVAACLSLTVMAKLVFSAFSMYGVGWLSLVSPSGHTSFSLTFYTCLATLVTEERSLTQRRIWVGAAMLLSLLVGASRIVREDHSGEEVVVGILIGGISVALFLFLRKRAPGLSVSPGSFAGFLVLLAAAAYLLNGSSLPAEKIIMRGAEKLATMLR